MSEGDVHSHGCTTWLNQKAYFAARKLSSLEEFSISRLWALSIQSVVYYFSFFHTRINIYVISLPCLAISSSAEHYFVLLIVHFFLPLSPSSSFSHALGISVRNNVRMCMWQCSFFFHILPIHALVCLSYTSSSFHNNKHYYRHIFYASYSFHHMFIYWR